MKKSAGNELSKTACTDGTERSSSIWVDVMVNLFKEELDKDFLVPDKLGLLVAEVDLELAVEFLVLDLDLGRGVKLAGDISICG